MGGFAASQSKVLTQRPPRRSLSHRVSQRKFIQCGPVLRGHRASPMFSLCVALWLKLLLCALCVKILLALLAVPRTRQVSPADVSTSANAFALRGSIYVPGMALCGCFIMM